ncbi:Chitin deacetylase [Choanephora cucurbitarum]|uniref:chitin deacetylase n=1 Tax=Choanephora cucurbitarum TaxID=101091 RepID=A0A1C7N3H0_9FUNG|nr:Chitin deacetylase [Choanephora cucurbitarum]
MLKAFLISMASTVALAAVDMSNFPTKTDPTQVTIPKIPQTTSYDVATECQYYQSNFTVDKAQWPTIWDIATSNGMNTSDEFMKVYNSIDWSKAPTAPVRSLTPQGGLNLVGYDTVNDPDCWWSATQCKKPKRNDINADIYACPEPETWGLTFDDGPNCSHNAFYDYLETNNQRASMFYIGSNVLNWPYGALRGLKDGHHLCGHTWSHKMMTTLTNQEVLAELYYTAKAIKYVTGVTPLHWRPALGDLDDRVRWIATQLNMTAILWNLDTDDWAAGSNGITADTVNQKYNDFIKMGSNGTFAQSGNIVLSHEINNMTMDFFVNHYPEIKKNYKHVMDVATCMNIAHPYLEKVVTFPSFDASVTQNASVATGSGVVPGATSVHKSGATHATSLSSTSLFTAALFGLLFVSL